MRSLHSPARSYIGRFAPSPSGPLHLGSLVCAVASFLDARHSHGRWLLRIEDIDPPREQAGATEAICASLAAHGLHWDGEIRHQSHRSEAYRNTLDSLRKRCLIYPCTCTRARLREIGGQYDGHCRQRNPEGQPHSWRLNTEIATLNWQLPTTLNDRIQGSLNFPPLEDVNIHRKDGLFAYQLAVVVDDIDQGITDVVRGIDLLDTTAAYCVLTHTLGGTLPRFAHLPVVVGADGHKLSKQTDATPVDDANAPHTLVKILELLGLEPDDQLAVRSPEAILAWAVPRWQPSTLLGKKQWLDKAFV